MPSKQELSRSMRDRFFFGTPVSKEVQAEYDRYFTDFPPITVLGEKYLERLSTADYMIRKTIDSFSEGTGIPIDWTKETTRPVPMPEASFKSGGKRVIPQIWNGSIIYNVRQRKPGGRKNASIEYYVHGGDKDLGLGTVSSVDPIKVRMPETLARRAPSLAMHQKLELEKAREFAMDPSLPTGLIGVFGEATAENVVTLLALSFGQPKK